MDRARGRASGVKGADWTLETLTGESRGLTQIHADCGVNPFGETQKTLISC